MVYKEVDCKEYFMKNRTISKQAIDCNGEVIDWVKFFYSYFENDKALKKEVPVISMILEFLEKDGKNYDAVKNFVYATPYNNIFWFEIEMGRKYVFFYYDFNIKKEIYFLHISDKTTEDEMKIAYNRYNKYNKKQNKK